MAHLYIKKHVFINWFKYNHIITGIEINLKVTCLESSNVIAWLSIMLQCRNMYGIPFSLQNEKIKRGNCITFFSQFWDYILQFKNFCRFNLELQDEKLRLHGKKYIFIIFYSVAGKKLLWRKLGIARKTFRILSLYLTVLRKSNCNKYFSQNFWKVWVELWDKKSPLPFLSWQNWASI